MTQDVGISALASFIIGFRARRGDAAQDRRVRERAAPGVRLLYFHILAPFPGTEVREKAAEYGLEILNSD